MIHLSTEEGCWIRSILNVANLSEVWCYGTGKLPSGVGRRGGEGSQT